MKLDNRNVPSELQFAIPMADRWGISDDYDREKAISNASRRELEEVAHCLDQVDDKILVQWLTGPESKKESLSKEYVSITNLTMAVHSAQLELKKQK